MAVSTERLGEGIPIAGGPSHASGRRDAQITSAIYKAQTLFGQRLQKPPACQNQLLFLIHAQSSRPGKRPRITHENPLAL